MKSLCLFVFRFALLFSLLTWPWSGLHEAVSACFRVETRFLVSAAFPGQAFRVQTLSDSRLPSSDTQVIVPDPQKVGPNGRMLALVIPFDSNSQGWVPLAMLMALGIATPLPWSKRITVLLAGIVFIQVLIAATILASVSFNLSNGISPVRGYVLFALANHLLVENIWFSFVPPFLLWTAWLAWSGNWKQLEEKLAGK
jgi:hypothetical protein